MLEISHSIGIGKTLKIQHFTVYSEYYDYCVGTPVISVLSVTFYLCLSYSTIVRDEKRLAHTSHERGVILTRRVKPA